MVHVRRKMVDEEGHPVSRKGPWKKKCDVVFSELIKYRDGWRCVETKARHNLQTAHVISRSYLATRWNMDNAVTLTAGRHVWYTHNPLEWREFCLKRLGKERYEELEKKARARRKWTVPELKELYAELTDKLEALRPSGR